MTQKLSEKTVSVGGVYKPRSWYEKQGYVLDDKFEDRNPCEWNAGLNQWTYLLAETAISEAENFQAGGRKLARSRAGCAKKEGPGRRGEGEGER